MVAGPAFAQARPKANRETVIPAVGGMVLHRHRHQNGGGADVSRTCPNGVASLTVSAPARPGHAMRLNGGESGTVRFGLTG